MMADYCIVIGNHLYNIDTIEWSDRHGIDVGGNYNEIIGNIIHTAKARGINISGDYNVVIHNQLYNISAEPIYDGGTDNKIQYNKGYITENSGTATFSGDGTTTTFDIPHGLSGSAATWFVQKASNISEDIEYVEEVTVDSTKYLRVHFESAPPSGTDNIVLKWQARTY